MRELVEASLAEASRCLERLRSDVTTVHAIAQAGQALGLALKAGHRVFSCGNGGSMADAIHFAEELSGRYRDDRPALAAQAISDIGHLSCVANDYGYDQVFSRYLEAHGRPGDWLLAISTSGKSPNIIRAVDTAQGRGMVVIGLHGHLGCRLATESDYSICTPGGLYADRVQEMHIKVIHILIQIVERVAFGVGTP